MEKCLKPHTAQPASNALFSLLCFEHFLCSLFCRVSWKTSERVRERERKRRKTTQKQNEEEKSIFIEKLWDFSCAFYPTTHSLLFVRAYIEKVAVTSTIAYISAFNSSLSALHGFFWMPLHFTGSCSTDFISFSPVSDHHQWLNLLWKSA